jgi:ubiquinone biosynthesis O-methyltransferase
MNAVRIPLVRQAVSGSPHGRGPSPLAGARILDVGSGGGILAEPMARLGARVTGIDASPDNVRAAAHHASLDPSLLGRLEYRCSTAEALASEAGQREAYDTVVCSEVLEHVAEAAPFLATLGSLVRPGGALVVTSINRTARSFAAAILAAEYVLRIVPAGTHEWAKFVAPHELEAALRPAGFVIEKATGLGYNPLSGRWFTSDDMGVNYAVIARKGAAEVSGESRHGQGAPQSEAAGGRRRIDVV